MVVVRAPRMEGPMPLPPLASVAAAFVASTLPASACLPGASQPHISPGYSVGVVRSTQGAQKDVGVIANMFRATQAQAAAMGASGLRTLSDGDIANPSALDGLKVIVLPEVKGLSDAQRATLAGWVKGGGGLVSLYFDGRDDQAGIPLTRRGLGGANRWGLLSPAFGARFLNDAFMEQASFALEAGHPLIAKAAAFCGGPVPDYAWRRRSGPTALTGELVSSAGSGFQPIGRLRSARITYQPAERRATPGAVFAFTNTYGAGRLVHFGFNFIDAWQPWTFQSYYRAVDPGAPNTGVALLRGSVEWAAGRA